MRDLPRAPLIQRISRLGLAFSRFLRAKHRGGPRQLRARNPLNALGRLRGVGGFSG